MPGAIQRYCCCGCVIGSDCTHCQTGTTPEKWTITISDLSLCTGCLEEKNAGEWLKLSVKTGFLNGTFVIEPDPLSRLDTCVWGSPKTGLKVDADVYSAAGCNPGDFDRTDECDVWWVLRRDATQWHLSAVVTFNTVDTGLYAVLFDDKLTATSGADCTTISSTFTNGLGACGNTGYTDYSFGTIGAPGIVVGGSGGEVTAVCT